MPTDLPYVERHMHQAALNALDTSRVVMLHGARQSGKTTLAKQIAVERQGSYASLDDDTVLAAAIDDPVSFLTAGSLPRVIDEVQRGGDRLIRAVKRLVDDGSPVGRFLLTGSTNFLTVPTISESLAGRVRLLELRPLSRSELAGRPPSAIDTWRDGTPDLRVGGNTTRRDYLDMACQGGYPGAIRLGTHHDARAAWFDDYATTVIGRDLGFLTSIRDESAMDRLLAWIAACMASTLNVAEAARRLGVTRPTLNRYLEWLRAVFLVDTLAAWSRNALGRAVRRPKIHLTDSGLGAALLATSVEALAEPTSTAVGPLLETFVVNEIARQTSTSAGRPALRHFRDRDGHEVDVILEWRDGSAVAIEVKASQSPSPSACGHLAWLRDQLDAAAPGTFRAGVLLHTGQTHVKLADRLYVAPIDTLWSV